jgi:hypothetical protein
MAFFFFNLNSPAWVVCTLFYAIIRPFSPRFDGSAHTWSAHVLATFTKLKSGS